MKGTDTLPEVTLCTTARIAVGGRRGALDTRVEACTCVAATEITRMWRGPDQRHAYKSSLAFAQHRPGIAQRVRLV